MIVHEDGYQIRGNTYVMDCINATVAAVNAPVGELYNVGGGEAATVWDVIQHLKTLAGRSVLVRQEPTRPGDQRMRTRPSF